MTKPKEILNVVIPSRKHNQQIEFLKKSTRSVKNQSIADQFEIRLLVGVDRNQSLDPEIAQMLGVTCIESNGASQAAALNAAIRTINDGYVAFLEDDDEWMPDYLKWASKIIQYGDFISSTQFEVNEKNELLRINDFATPSGWFMPASTLKAVGEFNEEYRFKLDNEWLGRLSELKLKRVHMVEATAPVHLKYIQQVRPWLLNIVSLSGGVCKLARHTSPYPLVKRLAHSESGMAMISTNQDLKQISDSEKQKLIARFGRIPW